MSVFTSSTPGVDRKVQRKKREVLDSEAGNKAAFMSWELASGRGGADRDEARWAVERRGGGRRISRGRGLALAVLLWSLAVSEKSAEEAA